MTRLLAAEAPTDADLVDAARLLMRHEGFPSAEDLQDDLAKAIRLGGLERDALHGRTRDIWAAEFCPSRRMEEPVGSGFDSAEQET